MSVQLSDSVLTAVRQVLELVRERHWRSGQVALRPSEVKEWLREVRVRADCNECQLPEELVKLRRLADDAKKANELVSLSWVMTTLLRLTLPVAEATTK